jgi:hypothetical protein
MVMKGYYDSRWLLGLHKDQESNQHQVKSKNSQAKHTIYVSTEKM